MSGTQPINDMLAVFLETLEFDQMAQDVITETDVKRIRIYARVILKNLPVEGRKAVYDRFAMLNLV